MRRVKANRTSLSLGLLLGLTALGCSTTHHRQSADREVYQLISERTPEVPGMAPHFSIEPVEISLDELPVVSEKDVEEFLGEAGKVEVGAHILSLEKALDIAVKNSREYQSQKESLYLQALGFTETRQRYRPVFSGRAQGQHSAQARDVSKLSGSAQLAQAAPEVIAGIGALTGTSADLLSAYADVLETAASATGANAPDVVVEQERSISGTTSFDVGMLMKGGAEIAVGLTSNFLRFLTGDPRVSTSSALLASIQQPIWGANRKIAAETLTQAERDLLYGLRSFTRFRQSFSIRVAAAYYGVLQSRDTVRNNWLGYQSFMRLLQRSEAEAEVGVITQTELGRTREGELQSKNRWVTAAQSYQDTLDEFKILLGLSTDAKIVLDDGEMERLMERGPLAPPNFSLDDAIKIAFAARLDYYTERDNVDDALRRLKLAENALRPDVELALDAGVNSKPGDRFQELDFKRYTWNAGLSVDPKFNRKTVRNRYREALISCDASKRGLVQFEDDTKLEVRQAWRELEQARLSYEIQTNSMRLSELRVLEQELLLEAGRGQALDRIDAQNDLIAARNNVSQALVNHTTAYLRLWLNMGLLYIKESGQWEDVTDVDRFKTS